jgi:hypothetical protein
MFKPPDVAKFLVPDWGKIGGPVPTTLCQSRLYTSVLDYEFGLWLDIAAAGGLRLRGR